MIRNRCLLKHIYTKECYIYIIYNNNEYLYKTMKFGYNNIEEMTRSIREINDKLRHDLSGLNCKFRIIYE